MKADEIVRKHIYVSGRVQGVGFRYTACYLARELGITGWVRNLYDGRVKMEIQGTEEQMNHLFRRLQSGRFISITDCEIKRIPVVKEHGFSVAD